MRLYHVSEDQTIECFIPRIPERKDLDQSIGLVWAIDEERLPNFLTPRDCPRVTYHIGINTTANDIKRYFTTPRLNHVVIIERKWFQTMKNTKLYLYEFDTSEFQLQDDVAGYYISTQTQIPIAKYRIDDLFQELFDRNVEVRIVDNLWSISDEIKRTTLNWSMCRMGNAQPRED